MGAETPRTGVRHILLGAKTEQQAVPASEASILLVQPSNERCNPSPGGPIFCLYMAFNNDPPILPQSMYFEPMRHRGNTDTSTDADETHAHTDQTPIPVPIPLRRRWNKYYLLRHCLQEPERTTVIHIETALG